MGSFGNIDILYMESLQKEWDESIRAEIDRKPIKFPISIDKIEIDEIESFGEKFTPSTPISSKIHVGINEINTKRTKNKNKCKTLL